MIDPHDARKSAIEDAMIERAQERNSVVRERPILFSAPKVRAILEGRKTQTRRVVKFQEHACLTGDCDHGKQYECNITLAAECHYGSRGDRLWVRETWRTIYDPSTCLEGALDIDYRADGTPRIGDISGTLKWKPSIFMPRWASRITLEVVSVRVERLQEISGEDCIAEGIDFEKHKCGCEICSRLSQLCPATESSLIMDYAQLWDSINKKTHPWSSNPWVWVIEFRKV